VTRPVWLVITSPEYYDNCRANANPGRFNTKHRERGLAVNDDDSLMTLKRKAMNITTEEMAEMSGVTASHVTNIEKGRRVLTSAMRLRLSPFYGGVL